MADTVQQVKDRLSIVDVVGQYVKLERSGSALRARCPFHSEKTPSFFVSPDRGTYHCFGCGVGGDIFSFVESIEGLDFKGALKVLAEKAGVELVYERGEGKEKRDERERLFELMEAATIFYTNTLTAEAKKYLQERGMEEGTIQQFRVGYAGEKWTDLCDYLKVKKFSEKEMIDAGVAVKGDRGARDKFRNRIIFPIADSAGRVVGFSGRIFGESASPDAPKYLNSPETPLFHKSRILFGFDKAKLAIRKHNFAVLVEGQMDLLASHQAGWPNTVAVSGTAFTPEHAQMLKRLSDNIVLALDADQAGIKAAGRAARAALQSGLNVKVAQLPSGLDPADLILKEGAEKWRAAIRDSKEIITFLLDVLEEHLKDAGKFRRAVETVVLPYLADVQSPIERDAYIREVAKRLGVSEAAVSDSYAKVPKMPAPVKAAPAPQKKEGEQKLDGLARAQQAYALLLWQRSLPRQAFDIKKFENALKDAVGEDAFAILEK
ncbi:MAG TPA: DNA primase, partial [Candidatus Paceibacterota bacterium]|nr:DNA primase [Candidatus Paceibacterota bacterium]